MPSQMKPVTPDEVTTIDVDGPIFATADDAERKLIELARDSPEVFIAYVSGLIPAPHMKDWLRQMFDFSDPKLFRLNFIAPRESSKSTIVVLAMLWFISRYPWKTNAIMSVSKDQAEKRMDMLRRTIEGNARFANVFPWIHIDYRQKNTQSEFSLVATALYDPKTKRSSPISYFTWQGLVSRFGSLKDPTLRTGGRGSKNIIGSRISGLFLCDDIIGEEDVNPLIQNEVYQYLMQTIIPLLQETAKMIYIGTRWMLDDVPEKIMHNPAWTSQVIVALTTDPLTGVLTSYWPSYWPVLKLLARKDEMDNAALFAVMYQNDPSALAAAKFRIDSLEQGLPAVLPIMKAVYLGTDFAVSLKQRADWSVLTIVGFDALDQLYILDMLRLKATLDEIVTALALWSEKAAKTYGRLDKLLFENVAFQAWGEQTVRAKYPHLPIEGVAPIGDKGHRLEPLALIFNDGRGYINKRMAEYPTFKAEALNFPLSHDDTLDSVTVVTSYRNARGSGKATTRHVRSRFLR